MWCEQLSLCTCRTFFVSLQKQVLWSIAWSPPEHLHPPVEQQLFWDGGSTTFSFFSSQQFDFPSAYSSEQHFDFWFETSPEHPQRSPQLHPPEQHFFGTSLVSLQHPFVSPFISPFPSVWRSVAFLSAQHPFAQLHPELGESVLPHIMELQLFNETNRSTFIPNWSATCLYIAMTELKFRKWVISLRGLQGMHLSEVVYSWHFLFSIPVNTYQKNYLDWHDTAFLQINNQGDLHEK